jgi:PadR family transcriptional regulator, regulatory protein PadR
VGICGTVKVEGDGAMAEKRELIKTNIESLLLSLLEKQAMYGYQIIKELAGKSQGYFRFKEGTLYPALHRLEKEGAVEGKWQTLPSGQQRKYYYITDKGCAALEQKLSNWNDFLVAMNMVIQGSER